MFQIVRLLLSLAIPDYSSCDVALDRVACMETLCAVSAVDYDPAECEGVADRITAERDCSVY